jgi:putative glycosyl hydrolase
MRFPAALRLGALSVPLAATLAVSSSALAMTARATAPTTAGTASPASAGAAKGAGAWPFRGAEAALVRSGASWYYTWGAGHPGIGTPAGVQFVPMIWGAASVTPANLRQAKRESSVLLSFNEPDSASQSDLTVAQALALWPRLTATGMTLGSPAVATDAATPGSWLARFMRGARARGYRVNFIAVHWYGGDFHTAAAVSQLRSYLVAIHRRYRKPIWLTEFALWRFDPSVFPSPAQQAAFLSAATSMLQRLPYVWRYAWFALPADGTDGTAGLFRAGAVPTAAGRAFEKVP